VRFQPSAHGDGVAPAARPRPGVTSWKKAHHARVHVQLLAIRCPLQGERLAFGPQPARRAPAPRIPPLSPRATAAARRARRPSPRPCDAARGQRLQAHRLPPAWPPTGRHRARRARPAPRARNEDRWPGLVYALVMAGRDASRSRWPDPLSWAQHPLGPRPSPTSRTPSFMTSPSTDRHQGAAVGDGPFGIALSPSSGRPGRAGVTGTTSRSARQTASGRRSRPP
jgi:hypothetical protein